MGDRRQYKLIHTAVGRRGMKGAHSVNLQSLPYGDIDDDTSQSLERFSST